MTLRDMAMMLRRRWYVVVAIVMVIATMTVFFIRDGGIYATKTLVMFTLPRGTTLTPENGSDLTGTIIFAGMIAAQVAPGGMDTRFYSHADAPLYGVGLREAVSVGLTDAGTQWSVNHNRAVVLVEIVGRSEEWVKQRQLTILSTIEELAHSEQVSLAVPPSQRIETHVEPMTMAIEHVQPSASAKLVAAMAMVAAAALLSFWCALLVDRVAAQEKRRKAPQSAEIGGMS